MKFTNLLYRIVFWRGLYFLSAFLLNILFARFYGASGSSSIYYLINLYSFVLLIATLGMESSMSFFLVKKEAADSSMVIFSLLWTLLLSILSLFLLELYFRFFDSDIPRDLSRKIALAYIPGQLLITFFTPFFYARDSPVWPNIILLAVNLGMILAIPVLPFAPAGIGKTEYLYIYFLGILTQGGLLAIVFFAKYGRGGPFSLPGKEVLGKIFRYSFIAFLANLLFFLVYRMDYWFVKKYCSAAGLGNYIQVSKLGQLILVIPGILATAVFPHTAGAKGAEMPVRLARMARVAVLLFLLLFLFIFLAGRSLFPLVFGDSFDAIYIPMLVILPGILFLSILALLSAYFGGLHRVDVNAWSALAGLVFITAGDFLFIPRYGIVGAAAVSSIGYFVCTFYSMRAFSKATHIGLKEMLVIRKDDWRWLKSLLTNPGGGPSSQSFSEPSGKEGEGYILMLAGWYPSRIDRFTGDFIQRHAQSVALYRKVVLLFLVKDPSLARGVVDIQRTETGRLTEYVVYYSATGPLEKAFSLLKYLHLAQKLIRRIQKENGSPICVHAHVVWKAGLLAYWLKKRSGWGYVLTEHWGGYTRLNPQGLHTQGWWVRKIYKAVYASADLFLPVSLDLAQQVNQWFPGTDFEVVGNTVDTRFFNYEPEEALPPAGASAVDSIPSPLVNPPPSIKKLIHVSDMSPVKNIEGILRVIERLAAVRGDFTLTLVGPATEELRRTLLDRGLLDTKVFLTGALSYPEVAAQVKRSQILFLFSRHENQPCVLLEAFCCGVPVIAPSTGGIPAMVDESRGILVPLMDEDGLLQAFHTLLDHYARYDRKKMAEEAREKYSYSVIGKQFSDIYGRRPGKFAACR